jgi:hypothetical protein
MIDDASDELLVVSQKVTLEWGVVSLEKQEKRSTDNIA